MLEHAASAADEGTDVVMSSSMRSMDITESFRPEDLAKTDFFDFVSAPEMNMGVDRPPGSTSDTNGTTGNDQPLQGFDQVSDKSFFFSHLSLKKLSLDA